LFLFRNYSTLKRSMNCHEDLALDFYRCGTGD